ncbi:MAG: DUF6527 family protein [Sulfitobacter sp.]
MHLCCCGCSREVVTPLSPTDWKLIFDGETLSLTPSVGNWNFSCRSHYFIRHDRVIEAGPWSDEMVQAEKQRDKAAKASYYGIAQRPIGAAPASTPACRTESKSGLWGRLQAWWRGE